MAFRFVLFHAFHDEIYLPLWLKTWIGAERGGMVRSYGGEAAFAEDHFYKSHANVETTEVKGAEVRKAELLLADCKRLCGRPNCKCEELGAFQVAAAVRRFRLYTNECKIAAYTTMLEDTLLVEKRDADMEEVLVAHVDGHTVFGARRCLRPKIQRDNYPFQKKRLCRACWCRLTCVSRQTLKRKIHRFRKFEKILKHKNDSITDKHRPATLRAQLAILLVGQKSREADPRTDLYLLARLGTKKVRWIALSRKNKSEKIVASSWTGRAGGRPTHGSNIRT